MTATFDPALATPKDRVRQKLGDTVVANALVQDETIAYYLTTEALSETYTAARLARDLAAQFAREVSFTVDGQGQKDGDLSRQFEALAERLEAQAATEAAAVAAGGSYTGGIVVTGATADEVIDARWDPARAANAPYKWP
jgi:phage terminase large subunit-like protein